MKLIPFRVGDKWGYSDSDGNLIIDAKYITVSLFNKSGFVQAINDDIYDLYLYSSLIDWNGTELLNLPEHYFHEFHESHSVVFTFQEIYDNDQCYLGNKYENRIINQAGVFIENNTHDFIGNFSNGHYSFGKMTNKLYEGDPHEYILGYKNRFGRTVIQQKYFEAPDFEVRWGGVPVRDEYSEYKFIEANGKYMFEAEYKYAKPFRNDSLAIVAERDYLFGYIGTNRKYLIQPNFNLAFAFSEGAAKVGIKEFSFKDQKVNELNINNNYPWSIDETGSYQIVYAFIDYKGKLLFKSTFDDAGAFSEGLCWVRKNNKFGYIDKNGNHITGYKYDSAFSFKEGLARVIEDNREYFINYKGIAVFEKYYEPSINNTQLEKDTFCQFKNNFMEFDLPNNDTGFFNGIAKVKENGKVGYIDFNGKEFWVD